MNEYNVGDIVKYQLNKETQKLAVIEKIRSNSVKGARVFELSDGVTIHEDQIVFRFDGSDFHKN
jgi:hypothetical protein